MAKPEYVLINRFGFPVPRSGAAELEEEYFDNLPNKKLFDIPYASQSPIQKLDIYYPVNFNPLSKYPAVMYFHGGGFMFGTKSDIFLQYMMPITKYDIILVSVNYRKGPEGKFPSNVFDAKAAIRFIRANAEKYNVDEKAIFSWGPSAGGWLAGIVGATNGNHVYEDLSMGNSEFSSDVAGAMLWCAPCGRFRFIREDCDKTAPPRSIPLPDFLAPSPPEAWFMGRNLLDIPERERLANIIEQVYPGSAPMIIQHGTNDSTVPFVQAKALYERAKEVLGPNNVFFEIGEGKGHHSDPWYIGGTDRIDADVRFMEKTLKNQKG